jgi:bla regulator protein blaR1
MQRRNAAVYVIAMVPVVAAAQQFLPAPPGAAVDPNTRYEVVAIKAGDPGDRVTMRSTPGRFEALNVPLGVLLRQALQKSDYHIVGIPGWTDTERYSIRATAPESIPVTANTTMLLNLLKDRFQLVTHPETRELPVFNLVMARPDGRLGPDLKRTPAECVTAIEERIAAAKAANGRGAPPPFPPLGDPNGPPPCGFQRMGGGVAAGSGRTLADLVPVLADLVSRPVIDKTGLTGMFDFMLKFAPESAGTPGILKLLGIGAPPPTAAVDPNAPSLVAALQEQLGLKLEGARGPVDVIVIDKFEKPTLD